MSTLADMRMALNLAGNTRDADRWTAEQWLLLHRAYKACDWDMTPDEWTGDQLCDALTRDMAPTWVYGVAGEHTTSGLECVVTGLVPGPGKVMK